MEVATDCGGVSGDGRDLILESAWNIASPWDSPGARAAISETGNPLQRPSPGALRRVRVAKDEAGHYPGSSPRAFLP